MQIEVIESVSKTIGSLALAYPYLLTKRSHWVPVASLVGA